FLREGAAIGDFKRPDRVVIGVNDIETETGSRAKAVMSELYRPLNLNESPLQFVGRRTSELIKYAANAFLAMKITFINEMADLCEAVGADVQQVARGIGLDKRIGSKFLHAGPGYGGSCFPKDTIALVRTAQQYNSPVRLIETTVEVNDARKQAMAGRVEKTLGESVSGKTVALLGLTFKPNTDDMRDAPSLDIAPALIAAGAKVQAFDPEGMHEAEKLLPEVEMKDSAYAAVEGADAVVIVTEWDRFRALDLEHVKSLMKTPVMVDLRNIYRGDEMARHGFRYSGIGRAERLLDRGETVIGVDNFNDYYDPALKEARAARLAAREGFRMVRADIADHEQIMALVRDEGVERIVHLAAQAGVRYSLENPFAYERSNLAGHLSILEAARHNGVEHLVYASSSSVYGDRPLDGSGFREDDPTVTPVSLYAATKRSCELLSQSYSTLYGFPQSGLRFFTVYGPWGRPDMAYFSFTRKIVRGEPIEVYGEGRMARDFTYVDDIVDGILGVLDHPPADGGHEVYNIGDSRPVGLMDMISALETALGVEAGKIMRPMQPGDVTATYADVSKLNALTGYHPDIHLKDGLEKFVKWWRGYENG
ncbi:hypothetical protein LTR94_024329, partial [Friedmanniomyces endolithicus]